MWAKEEFKTRSQDKKNNKLEFKNIFDLISTKNRKGCRRDIYSYLQKIYISVDFESGCFEVYNQRGKHLGEYSYTGEKLHDADKSGKLDIIL